MLRDNIPAFYIEGVEGDDDKAWVGFIWSSKGSLGINFQDYFSTLPRIKQFNFSGEKHPYDIGEVSSKDKETWQNVCKEFSKRYKSWGKDLDREIKDRTRSKEDPKRFEVFTY